MMSPKIPRLVTALLTLSLLLTACAGAVPAAPTALSLTSTPATLPAVTSMPALPLRISFTAAVPLKMQELVRQNTTLQFSSDSADFTLELDTSGQGDASWVYTLVSAFPTISDGVTLADLKEAWQGQKVETFPGAPLVMSAETRALLTAAWGSSGGLAVEVVAAPGIPDRLWQEDTPWGIIPFEELNPRLKLLTVDGFSPFRKDLDPSVYPLAFRFRFAGDAALRTRLDSALQGTTLTNRDESKMTTVLLTGVTALARRTAMTMNEKGVLYPAENIGDLLRSADITHTSNEASFFSGCPAPRETFQRFCSDPAYLQLLQHAGVDVVELTGNHLVDYGTDSMLESLELYRLNGFKVYGGGENLQGAAQALLIEDHGNKIAFAGCNFVGPESVWATESTPGANPCSSDPEFGLVKQLSDEGYNVIYTIQFIENCEVKPLSAQRTEFRLAAEAGAALVIGSQAHCPQGFSLAGGTFIHYGLGNLFFDQMMEPNRLEFLDWAVFYEGRLLGVDLVTARLYDYAQPALTAPAERARLLNQVFENSEWK